MGQFDLIPIMDGQPLTLLARTRDGSSLGRGRNLTMIFQLALKPVRPSKHWSYPTIYLTDTQVKLEQHT